MNIFSQIAAGDSANWNDVAFQDSNGINYSSAGYTLKYSIRGNNETLDLTATTSGTGWNTAISSAQSAALNTGNTQLTFWWQAYAIATGVRVLAGEGSFILRPNLAVISTPYDGRSQEEIDLAAIKAEISNRASNGASIEYTIGNRHLKREPLSALLALEARYNAIIARQRAAQSLANGTGNPRRALITFNPS